jgi:hypothetical protein
MALSRAARVAAIQKLLAKSPEPFVDEESDLWNLLAEWGVGDVSTISRLAEDEDTYTIAHFAAQASALAPGLRQAVRRGDLVCAVGYALMIGLFEGHVQSKVFGRRQATAAKNAARARWATPPEREREEVVAAVRQRLAKDRKGVAAACRAVARERGLIGDETGTDAAKRALALIKKWQNWVEKATPHNERAQLGIVRRRKRRA